MEENQVNGVLELNSADAMSFELEIAGIGARSYAFVLDWHIRLLVAIVWIYLSAFLFYDLSVFATMFGEETTDTVAPWIIFLPPAIIYFFYHPILEIAMRGSTPGKRTAGVRLVTLEGHTPGVGSILIRNIFRLIDSLPGVYTVGIIVTMLAKNHVRIGDMAAGTVLIYDKESGKQALSEVAQQSLDSNLSAGDYDLLLEILERWRQLDKKKRMQLGHQYLRKIGDNSQLDNQKQLLAQLKKLAGK